MERNCTFCRIVAGQAEASFAYEDKETVAFMDLGQLHPGHTLVVPRTHVEDIFALDDATGSALMAAVTTVARSVRDAFAPDGVSVWQSNGEAAGQEVLHLHVHVLPRWKDDGLFRARGPGAPASRADLDDQAERIRRVTGA